MVAIEANLGVCDHCYERLRAVLIMLFLVSRFLNEVSPVLNSKNSAKSVLIKKLAKMVSFGFVSLISPFLKRYFRHLIL
jgi:hypothetical protein